MSGDHFRDLGGGEGGAIGGVVEEDGDEDKIKDDLNRSQSPSAMSQSSNYLEWDPSADVGALSAIPGSSSSGGRGRDELYLGEHFEDSESPEIKVIYGPKKLLKSNPSDSNHLYCYSTPQSSRTSRVTFSSFDCSPIDIQSPPEYKESTPSSEVSVKESCTKATASSTEYKSVGTVGSVSLKQGSDTKATVFSTEYKSVGTVGSVSLKQGSDTKATVFSTEYKSVAPQKSALKKTSKAKEVESLETRSPDTGRYFADESNNNNTVEERDEDEEEEEEDLTVEENSRRTPPGVVVSDASTDWEYDQDKKSGGSGGYRPDWRTHGITRSEIEYAERKKSGTSSSASSSVFLLQVEALAKNQCGAGRGQGTSSADEGGNREDLPPVPPSTQRKSKSRSSMEVRSRGTASGGAELSSSSASGPISDESELERRLNDIRSRCPAISSSASRRHRSPNGSDPNSLTLSSNAGCSTTSSSSLGVDPETLLKILESHPSTESVKYDALKIHRDYHLAQVWKQIAKLAELNRALLTVKASKEDGVQGGGDGAHGRGSRSVQKINKACGPSEPSSMISGFEGRSGPSKRYASDPIDYVRKKVTNEDIARAKQEMERNPKRAEHVIRKTEMAPPPPPKQRGVPSKKKTVIVPPPPPVKVFLAPQKPIESTSTVASGGDSETDDTGPLKKAIKNYLKKHNMELYKSIKADVSATSSSGYSRLEQSSMKESVGLPSDGYLSDSFVYLRERDKAHGIPLKMAREMNQLKKVEELRANLRKAIEKQHKQQPQVRKGKKKPPVGFYIALGEEKEEGDESKGPKKTIEEYLKEYNPQCYKNIKERDEILIQVKRDREANHVQMDYFIEQAAAYQRQGAGKDRVAGYRGVGNGWGDGNREDLKEFWEKYMLTAQKKANDENKENENVMNMRKSPESPHVISTREMKARTARLRTNDSVAYARRRKEIEERRRKATRLLQKQFSENLREFRKVIGDVNVPDRLKLGPRP